ncbi:hypothetical protein [Sediminitomix flava]|uniref:Tetratricopeptide repeat protein n=1 Tax=Sediminitomix flava TaxID=379075 RepID=A0A315ZJW2_SEDFL|nr:hypothetical protein [Sediminitomix flava]PWJ44974.1 hypothetical protein BC781_1011370 [Sediminitomix flava]
MKKTFTLLFTLFCLVNVAFAQKPDRIKLEFQYIKLPKVPFPGGERTFKLEGEAANKEEVENLLANWQAEKDQIDLEYETAIENKKDEIEAYNKKKVGERLANAALGVKAPSLDQVVKKPYPAKPYVPKVYDAMALANQHVEIEGLVRDENSSTTLKFVTEGFKYHDYGIVGDSLYTASYEASNPIKLVALTSEGQELYSLHFKSSDAQKFTWGSDTNKYKLKLEWKKQRNNELSTKEEQLKNNALFGVKFTLNDYYGYTQTKYKDDLWVGKSKKLDYSKQQEAATIANEGYFMILRPELYEKATEKLTQAIGIWEEELKEADKSKKARISPKVQASLHYNIAHAYLWMNNFEKMAEHFVQISMIGEGKFERKMKSLERFAKGYRTRYDAYQKALAQQKPIALD